MKNYYSIQYFISKYENTKEDDWCQFHLEFNDKKCALGQCGVTVYQSVYQFTPEALGLFKILGDHLEVTAINDKASSKYRQETPRQRILAALYDKLAEANVIEASKLVNEKVNTEHVTI